MAGWFRFKVKAAITNIWLDKSVVHTEKNVELATENLNSCTNHNTPANDWVFSNEWNLGVFDLYCCNTVFSSLDITQVSCMSDKRITPKLHFKLINY